MSNHLTFAITIAFFAISLQSPAAISQPSNATVTKELMRKELLAAPDKEVVMSTVEYQPGGSSPPHRHYAQVFVFVLEGHVNMQVKGGPLMTFGPGETFYERPTDVHIVSANASKSEPAKFLAILIKDKGKPGSLPPGQAR
jgi:quercetin dioxygenase-like cupin family protein